MKTRYIAKLENGIIAEIDDFKGTDKVVVEVEFKNEEKMNSFVKPTWFGEEVPDNKMYSKVGG